MDYILHTHMTPLSNGELHISREEKRSQEKLKIIMSTILWLSHFFPNHQWEDALTSTGTEGHNQTRIRYLAWLNSARVPVLLENDQEFLEREPDRRSVNALWEWFSNHHHRAVQVAFLISRFVKTRDVGLELRHFIRVFSQLSQTLKSIT